MRIKILLLFFIAKSAVGQPMVDSLQSFARVKSKLSDSYIVTFEIKDGYPLNNQYIKSPKWGEVYIYSEAYIFEFRDSAINSWRLIYGIVENDTVVGMRNVFMLSRPNRTFSGKFDYKEVFNDVNELQFKGIVPGIAMEIQSNGDTLYRELLFMHRDKYKIGIFRAGDYVLNYEVDESYITTREDIEFQGQLRNLNYKYNLSTLQYKVFDWLRENSIKKAKQYAF